MDSHAMLIQNKYKLIEQIGEGTYSRVYLAHHVLKNHNVAVKINKNSEISSKLIKHEIDVYLHLLRHKITNISSIKSFGVFENSQYIIMEYLNMDLKEYVSKNKDQITMSEINTLMMQCFRLLKNMHDANLVHRDIKPENFMFDKKKNLCIIDFGLSCDYKPGKSNNKCVGTPSYSSYNTHKDSYIYTKIDDFNSVFYMFFDLFGGKLPWDNLYFNNEKSKKIVYYEMKKYSDYNKFYEGNEIVQNIVRSYYNFNENHDIRFYS